jgi:hypothetical protein
MIHQEFGVSVVHKPVKQTGFVHSLAGIHALLQLLWNKISAWRFTVILTALVTVIFAATLIRPGVDVYGFSALRLALTFLALSVVLASTDRRKHLVLIAVLVASWLAATWSPVSESILIDDAVLVVILFYIVFLITARLVNSHKISIDEISGGIAVYFCLAVAWAVSYRLLDNWLTEAFSVQFAGDFSAPLYLSLSTITTLGYGDITPVAPIARIWVTFEAVVGLLYVAILISRLVSEFRR